MALFSTHFDSMYRDSNEPTYGNFIVHIFNLFVDFWSGTLESEALVRSVFQPAHAKRDIHTPRYSSLFRNFKFNNHAVQTSQRHRLDSVIPPSWVVGRKYSSFFPQIAAKGSDVNFSTLQHLTAPNPGQSSTLTRRFLES